MTENFRLFFGRWFGVVVLAAIAGLTVWFLLNFNPVIDRLQNKLFATDAQREIKRLENLYKNDKYGGKTPEETFDLFIDALKKEDTCPAVRKSLCGIELASKYFVLNKQDDWLRTLKEYKEQKVLADYVRELENLREKWEREEGGSSDIVEFYSTTIVEKETEVGFRGQKLKVPAGDYTNTTRFEKYPSGVWKIGLL